MTSTLVVFSAATLCFEQIVSTHPLAGDDASATPPAIVIGFVGGFIAHDDMVHGEVQFAARLRAEYRTPVEIVEKPARASPSLFPCV